MSRVLLLFASLMTIAAAALVAHLALIEVGREVIVLRTQAPDGSWRETRLWIVDDAGAAFVHGADSHWMHDLAARPVVEVVRAGEAHRYRATPVPGPHPRIHALLRAKYGIADRWVRFLGPDTAATLPVRLDRLPSEEGGSRPH